MPVGSNPVSLLQSPTSQGLSRPSPVLIPITQHCLPRLGGQLGAPPLSPLPVWIKRQRRLGDGYLDTHASSRLRHSVAAGPDYDGCPTPLAPGCAPGAGDHRWDTV